MSAYRIGRRVVSRPHMRLCLTQRLRGPNHTCLCGCQPSDDMAVRRGTHRKIITIMFALYGHDTYTTPLACIYYFIQHTYLPQTRTHRCKRAHTQLRIKIIISAHEMRAHATPTPSCRVKPKMSPNHTFVCHS